MNLFLGICKYMEVIRKGTDLPYSRICSFYCVDSKSIKTRCFHFR